MVEEDGRGVDNVIFSLKYLLCNDPHSLSETYLTTTENLGRWYQEPCLTNKVSQLTETMKFAQSITLFPSLACSAERQNQGPYADFFFKNPYVKLKEKQFTLTREKKVSFEKENNLNNNSTFVKLKAKKIKSAIQELI